MGLLIAIILCVVLLFVVFDGEDKKEERIREAQNARINREQAYAAQQRAAGKVLYAPGTVAEKWVTPAEKERLEVWDRYRAWRAKYERENPQLQLAH